MGEEGGSEDGHVFAKAHDASIGVPRGRVATQGEWGEGWVGWVKL